MPTTSIAEKLSQIEEQLRGVVEEHPNRIALDRVKLALALTRHCQMQLDAARDLRVPFEVAAYGPR